MTALIELHYLPCLAYFCAIDRFDSITLEKQEHFVKQTYRNRCYINTAHGKHELTIPVKARHGKIGIAELEIDYSQKWLNNHWRSICSAYGKAPFFEYYEQDLHSILYSRTPLLYELNFNLLTMCLRWLRSNHTIRETLSFEKKYSVEFCDLRSYIAPKDTRFISQVYEPVSYYQVFGNAFVANLSIIDLVFCCGPEASRILRSSERGIEQIQY